MPDWLVAVLLLAVGGGTGANARFWFGRFVARLQGEVAFPWATFLINVSGSIILGLVAASFMRHPDPSQRNWYILLGAGFCGGFTTFSTFSYETYRLMEDGRLGLAAVYSLGSVVAGLLGVWAALKLSGTPAGG